VYSEADPNHPPPSNTPTTPGGSEKPSDHGKKPSKDRVIIKIPPKVIANAVGLAIFTTARVGFQFSGATGSGVLVARLPDGTWSPPSGIQVHAIGAGFMIGVDIYDCVCVINSKKALAAFMDTRVSLGSEVAVAAGPYGAGGSVDFGAAAGSSRRSEDSVRTEQKPENPPVSPAVPAGTTANVDDSGKLKPEGKEHRRRSSSSALRPVFSYVKSRGFYAGVQVDGTVITERKDANAAFYGEKLSVEKILLGQVPAHGPSGMWPVGAKSFLDVLKAAEAGKLSTDSEAPPPAHQQPSTQTAVPIPIHPHPQSQPVSSSSQPPGYVGVPLETQHNQAPPSSKQQEAFPPPPPGPPPTGAYPGPPGGPGEETLPPYVDDGRPRPGVGDQKTTYQ
jgi:SH3 domain-containing YSC84-like protein 1